MEFTLNERFHISVQRVELAASVAGRRVSLDQDGLIDLVGAQSSKDVSVAFVQVAGGLSIGFGEASGGLVAIDAWNAFAGVVDTTFPGLLDAEECDLLLRVSPRAEGAIIDLSEESAHVDLKRGIWWTRQLNLEHLAKVGENIYVSIDAGASQPIGLAITFPPRLLEGVVRGVRAKKPRYRWLLGRG